MGDCICVRRGDGPEGCGICNETGTAPDIAGLCERLRDRQDHAFHGSKAGRPINPDGPEAADTIERQAAEMERLRGALGYYSYADDGGKRARAALTGEDTAGLPTSQNTEPGLAFSNAGEP
jgi:hypothetical protein